MTQLLTGKLVLSHRGADRSRTLFTSEREDLKQVVIVQRVTNFSARVYILLLLYSFHRPHQIMSWKNICKEYSLLP